MTTLHDHIMTNYRCINEYATHTQRNYPRVKRWCDKGAVIIDELIYVPSTQLRNDNAPNMITLKDHINNWYDGSTSAAAAVLGRHRNQLATWCKRGAILIDGRIWLPRGIA